MKKLFLIILSVLVLAILFVTWRISECKKAVKPFSRTECDALGKCTTTSYDFGSSQCSVVLLLLGGKGL